MKLKHLSDHRKLRKAEYPPIEDQLDALWHAMDSGLLPKIPGFYDRIAAVKNKLPKRTDP